MSTPTAPRLAHEGFGRVTVSDEWVAYATRYGSGMVMKTAKQDGLGPEDLDRLAFALRELDPKFSRRAGTSRGRDPGTRSRPSAGGTGRASTAAGRCPAAQTAAPVRWRAGSHSNGNGTGKPPGP
jgi:hypothetical protein